MTGLLVGLAIAVCAAVPVTAQPQAGASAEVPALRLGILSDTHVTGPESSAELAKAFQFLRKRDVSAVLHCGDVTDRGSLAQLDTFAATWKSVFDAKTELIVALGNRDLMDSGRIPAAERERMRDRAIYPNPAKSFRERLGVEAVNGIAARRLNGAWVVSAAWKTEGGLEDFFLSHPEIAASGLPVITLQHQHHQGTVFGGKLADWATGDPRATCWLRMFPEAISFSGHSHRSNQPADAVWQGDFVAAAAGSYCLEKGPDKGGREVSVLTVEGNVVTLERCDLRTGALQRNAWTLRVPTQGFAKRDGDLVFLQYNLGHFALGQASETAVAAEDSAARAAAFKRLFGAWSPDIACFCEYSTQFDRSGARTRERLLGDFANVDEGPQDGFQCNAVAVRRGGLKRLARHDYAEHRQGTYYMSEEIELDGKKVVVVVTHLDLTEPQRKAQIAKLVRAFADEPRLVISGDFNVADPSEYAPFAAAGLTAANCGAFGNCPTHRRRQIGFTPAIDNVFVRGLRIEEVCLGDFALTLSDHRPLLCRLRLEP